MSKDSITIEELAEKIDGLAESQKSLASTIDELARMTAEGFNEVGREIGTVRDELHQLREQNDRDHLDLKLRQGNVAYRFELQDLDKRVTNLEKKAKFA